METVYLQGSEDVRRAANTIQDAAQSIQSAANYIGESIHNVINVMENSKPVPRAVEYSKYEKSDEKNVGWVLTGPHRGTFSAWGSETDETGTYTVAIIENHDGSISTALPKNMRFL